MSDTEVACQPSLSGTVIFVRYILFAVAAGITNVATQAIISGIYPRITVTVSILAGTAIGFLVKYILDKRWVFLDGYQDPVKEVRKITAYGAFGVGTTLLFWGVELSAWHIWQTTEAKYVGAVVGLTLGNWTKYLLDKRFVFPRRSQ